MSDEWDKERKKNPKTCQLCGRTDPDVDLFCGGFVGYAHHDCAEIASKGVELYLRYLTISPRGIIWFAQELLEADSHQQFTVVIKGEENSKE